MSRSTLQQCFEKRSVVEEGQIGRAGALPSIYVLGYIECSASLEQTLIDVTNQPTERSS